MRRDHPVFQVSDAIGSECQDPTRLLAHDVPNSADGRGISRHTPKTKLDTVEPVDIAARRQEPEKTIGRLRDRVHAGGRGTILGPP